MNKQGRTDKVAKNSLTNVIGQGLQILLQFVSRTVFIYVLGKEYLGISSLFTNILTVLSVTELGLGSAIAFSLYKPLADSDEKKIRALMQLYKKAYNIIGFVVLLLGIALIPVLPYLMKDTTDLVNIRLYYILYLMQSVSSYWFFAYKATLLNADQKQYIYNIINYITLIIGSVARIVILLVFKSFLIYTICGILTNIFGNYAVSKRVDKLYPYLDGPSEQLDKDDKTTLYKNVFSTSLYKVNSVIVSSVDNIVISSFISVVAVGFYGNYNLIVSSVESVLRLLISSIQASVGNMYQTESAEKTEKVFRAVCFICFWIYGWCAICLGVLLNPFIELWVGEEYLFGSTTVMVIVIDFLTKGFQRPSIIYKDACGLFWQGKFRPLITACINLFLSVLLAPKYGIAGIVLATIVSRFLTIWWFEPMLVYKHAFKKSVVGYFYRYFVGLGVTIIIYLITDRLCSIFTGLGIVGFSIELVICSIIPNMLAFAIFRKTEEFAFVKEKALCLVRSNSKRSH